MIRSKNELIKYRIERAFECLDEARILAESNYWNTVANRLYYACFYIVGALIIKHEPLTNSHLDVKSVFWNDFVETGILDKNLGEFYEELFLKSQEEDFDEIKVYQQEEIGPLSPLTENFLKNLNSEIHSTKDLIG